MRFRFTPRNIAGQSDFERGRCQVAESGELGLLGLKLQKREG